jgi:hypothetical protein
MGDLLLDTVLFLAQHRSRAGEPGIKLLSEASGKFTRVDERELERFFKEEKPDRGDTSEMGKFDFLPLVSKPRILPVLSLAYDTPNDIAKLQVALFTETERGIRAFGYRFESPEGPGQHNFWHAQPILQVRCHGETTIDLPGLEDGWRPTNVPAFPLDARSSIGLLVSLLVSIYGIKELWQVQADSFENRLAAALRELVDPTMP